MAQRRRSNTMAGYLCVGGSATQEVGTRRGVTSAGQVAGNGNAEEAVMKQARDDAEGVVRQG